MVLFICLPAVFQLFDQKTISHKLKYGAGWFKLKSDVLAKSTQRAVKPSHTFLELVWSLTVVKVFWCSQSGKLFSTFQNSGTLYADYSLNLEIFSSERIIFGYLLYNQKWHFHPKLWGCCQVCILWSFPHLLNKLIILNRAL